MKLSKPRRARRGGSAIALSALLAASGLAASGLAPWPAAAAAAGTTGPAVAGARPGAARVISRPAAAMSQRTITLINGDRIVATRSSSGMQTDAVAPAGNGLNRALVNLDLAGKVYEIPVDALPYLGRGLSPSLFEVNSLLAAERDGRLPVQVSHQRQLLGLPGVTITKSGARGTQGYLTAASAAAFGAALARQAAADHARGSYGSDGMFGGGVSIGLPGQATALPARPDYPMHTLTVTGSNLSGQPDTGDTVDVFSADSLARFNGGFNVFDHGVAKFSVPSGHYAAIALFSVMSGTTVAGYRMVVLPQFTVTQNTSVATAETAASDQVQIVTPRPAITQDVSLGLLRGLADGDVFSYLVDAGPLPLWTNETTGPVTVGTLRTATTARLTSPASAGQQYEYDLDFAGPVGRIASQHFVVTARSLAVVRAAYYQNGGSLGTWNPLSWFRFQYVDGLLFNLNNDNYPFPLPQSETQYTSAGPSLIWRDTAYQTWTTFAGAQTDAYRTFAPGQSVNLGWNAYPLHPTPSVNLLGTANPFPVQPTASRAGNMLTLDVVPFGDNTFGHTGTGFFAGQNGKISGSYELDQNGKKIAAGTVTQAIGDLFLQANLSSQPATDRLVVNATRTGRVYQVSPQTQTIWTWRSAPEPGATLPGGWVCPAGNQACAVQPMMTLLYQVAGLGVDGFAPAGNELVVIKAGHLQLAPAAPVTAMTVSVSFNNGKTWQPAAVSSLGGGTYTAAFTAPAPLLGPIYASLRVQATDGAGNSITETVTRAYEVTVPIP